MGKTIAHLISTDALVRATKLAPKGSAVLSPDILGTLDPEGVHVITGFDPFSLTGEGSPNAARVCCNVMRANDTAMTPCWFDLPLPLVESLATCDGSTVVGVLGEGSASIVPPRATPVESTVPDGGTAVYTK